MSSQHQYLVCSQRPGSPRVALEVCRICRKARYCQAWREFRCPVLFPGLEASRPRAASRAPRLAVAAHKRSAAQTSLPLT